MNAPRLLLPLALLASTPAAAAEVVWDGYYRAESHYYNSLSLSDTNTNALGAASWFEHKARLRPGFLLSDSVGLYTQLDLLPSVVWGDMPVTTTDLTTGSDLPLVYSQAVQPPTTGDDAATLQNIKLSRLWGEVWFHDIGRLRFGRMPVQWGSGMVFNAGNNPSNDQGDTEDRVQFTAKAGPLYVMGAYGVPSEGYLGEGDDMPSVSASVAHLTEQASVGGYGTYRWQNYDSNQVGLFIGDIWGKAALGPVRVEGEFATVLGSGDLDTGANDVSISAFGAMLDTQVDADKLIFGLGLGLASGDRSTDDKRLHTFAFDPDFDVALLMFEQPMPLLGASVNNDNNAGLNTDAVRTANGLSNAVYLKPTVGYHLRDDLSARLSLFAAQAARLPEADSANKGYGSELDLQVDYKPVEHFGVQGIFGTFFPGNYYKNYEDDTLGGGFDSTAFGFRLQSTVSF